MNVFFSFLFACTLALDPLPWEMDAPTKERLNQQIESVHKQRNADAVAQGKKYYLIDFERRDLNFSAKDCVYCQNQYNDPSLTAKLSQANFIKRSDTELPYFHCFGTTLFLIQHLLYHPQAMENSCSALLSEIATDPNFHQTSHLFQWNQPPYYRLEGTEYPIQLNPEAMKDFFHVLVGVRPTDYHVVPFSSEMHTMTPFEKATIYATLRNLPNKLLLIGYINQSGRFHCIAISTCSQKLWVFDANLGIYHFPDLETLSWTTGEVLGGCEFHWLIAFDKES